jgi:hypothetical protein
MFKMELYNSGMNKIGTRLSPQGQLCDNVANTTQIVEDVIFVKVSGGTTGIEHGANGNL